MAMKEELTDEERRALRGSKFAPLPSAPPSSRSIPRLAHPGGPLKTNKAAALAKFLERKLQQPDGLASVDPQLVESAVKNAKDAIKASGVANSDRRVQHVDSFGDSKDFSEEERVKESKKEKKAKKKKKKMKKDKKKNKKQKIF